MNEKLVPVLRIVAKGNSRMDKSEKHTPGAEPPEKHTDCAEHRDGGGEIEVEVQLCSSLPEWAQPLVMALARLAGTPGA